MPARAAAPDARFGTGDPLTLGCGRRRRQTSFRCEWLVEFDDDADEASPRRLGADGLSPCSPRHGGEEQQGEGSR